MFLGLDVALLVLAMLLTTFTGFAAAKWLSLFLFYIVKCLKRVILGSLVRKQFFIVAIHPFSSAEQVPVHAPSYGRYRINLILL